MQMNKKRCFLSISTILFVASLLIVPLFTNASSVEELQGELDQKQDEIKSLEEQKNKILCK